MKYTLCGLILISILSWIVNVWLLSGFLRSTAVGEVRVDPSTLPYLLVTESPSMIISVQLSFILTACTLVFGFLYRTRR